MLPVGVQTFRKMRESGGFYVDKTAFAAKMIAEGTHYFLSRPRRFGKSVFIDTLKELFEGSEELFEGLAVHSGWDWSVRHPVVRLSFGSGCFTERGGLQADLLAQLELLESEASVHDAGLRNEAVALPGRFRRLLSELHRRSGRRVVVLVDEYDKPILDAIADPGTARANRDFLRGLYAAVKDSDAHIRFVFLTGVSKFSKVSLFSGLNNLIDITLEPEFSSVCGFTEADLDEVFAAELQGLDRDRIQEWYNGYSWLGSERVYNPYDILLLLRKRVFKAHWFETGTPAFLVDTITERGVPTPSLTQPADEDELLSSFDVDHIGTEALLFQTGHLTITGVHDDDGEAYYDLDYPNREVRQSLNKALLRRLVDAKTAKEAKRVPLLRLLDSGDVEGLHTRLHSFYASIPHEWHTNNDIARFEGYYASVFYSYFATSGLDVAVEDSTSLGRVDMAVSCSGHTYVFEFKIAGTSPRGAAMEQLKQQRYADKYRNPGTTVHLIAVEFSREARNITGFEAAVA